MDNPYEHLRLAAGQQSLFGRTIEQSEIIDLISKYPASQWLDLFAKIEGFLVIQRDKNFDSQTYLAGEIFCPSALQRTQRPAYAKNIYFSLGQLNLARKLAIAYGSRRSPNSCPPGSSPMSRLPTRRRKESSRVHGPQLVGTQCSRWSCTAAPPTARLSSLQRWHVVTTWG